MSEDAADRRVSADYYGDDAQKDAAHYRRVEDKWHIGREIPIAVLIVLLVQTGGAVWWASKMDSRIQTIADQFNRFDIERYTKEDARRDRELFSQMFKTNEILITQFDRRMQNIEGQHEQMRRDVGSNGRLRN